MAVMKFYELSEDELYNLPVSTSKHDDFEIAMKAAQRKLIFELTLYCTHDTPSIPRRKCSLCWNELEKDFGMRE